MAIETYMDRTISASWYTDAKHYSKEREGIFSRTWQIACRRDQLRSSGDFVTTDIAGYPILLTVDSQESINAMANVCRHRASRILSAPCGQTKRLTCPYHGWTYNLSGKLAGVPDDCLDDLPERDKVLPKFAVDHWGPYVLIAIEDPRASLAETVEPLSEMMSTLQINRFEFAERMEWDLNCNWKVFVDNYQDGGYHINSLHPGLAKVVDMSTYRTEAFTWNTLQSSPLQTARGGSDAGSLNETRKGDQAYYWWTYPNWMVNAYENVMDVNIVLPTGPNSCRVVFDFFFAPEIGDDQRVKSLSIARQVQEEDLGICEDVQRGLESGLFEDGRFVPRRELGVQVFHSILQRDIDELR